MAELELHRVRKVYPGGIVGLEDVSLTIQAGECFVLLGPSGSGKSTLLRLIAGLEESTGGTIHIRGRNVAAVPPHERGVSYLGQRPVLYPDRPVRGNLTFGIAVENSQLDEIASLLGIAGLLDRRPGELSGGQLQRVALGRALLRDAPILLLDEPLTSLDGPMRWDLRRILHLLQSRRRATMIYVTHDQEEALSLADRLAVFEEGRLVQVGTPAEVLSRPATAFVARHLGWPPMTLHRERRDGRDVLFGWRSEGGRNPGDAFLFDALTGCLLEAPSGGGDIRPGSQSPTG